VVVEAEDGEALGRLYAMAETAAVAAVV